MADARVRQCTSRTNTWAGAAHGTHDDLSADGNGGPPYQEYRMYFDPAYRDCMDELAVDSQLVTSTTWDPAWPSYF